LLGSTRPAHELLCSRHPTARWRAATETEVSPMRRNSLLLVACLLVVASQTPASADPDAGLERRRAPVVTPPDNHGGLETAVPGLRGDVVPIQLPEPAPRRDRVPPQHDATAAPGAWWQHLLAWVASRS
jgi:hypothetical protein